MRFRMRCFSLGLFGLRLVVPRTSGTAEELTRKFLYTFT